MGKRLKRKEQPEDRILGANTRDEVIKNTEAENRSSEGKEEEFRKRNTRRASGRLFTTPYASEKSRKMWVPKTTGLLFFNFFI